jgi:hypothetical protein
MSDTLGNSPANPADAGKCVHFQPADLIELTERHLREAGVPEAEWEGRRFHWAGPIDSPPFTGLVLQCKRKEGQWVLTKLDRRKDGVTAEETGFREIP